MALPGRAVSKLSEPVRLRPAVGQLWAVGRAAGRAL